MPGGLRVQGVTGALQRGEEPLVQQPLVQQPARKTVDMKDRLLAAGVAATPLVVGGGVAAALVLGDGRYRLPRRQ